MPKTACKYFQGSSLRSQRIELIRFLLVEVVALPMAESSRSFKSISDCDISLTGTQWDHQKKMQRPQIYPGVSPVTIS